MKLPKLPKLDLETKIYVLIAIIIFIWILLLPTVSSYIRQLIDYIQGR